ncbi:MAG: hypothetical protein COU90_00080 [Candidatus Ryanbacteria bacterium CG10_big_fil_rev_8_21_14_0_10_43_42]|uniref:DUF7282 domain-containing protein n=1 Tax=Candidatus Ryanbacteria bacterium CG10_big_fil_rev_8_21_14_0_10_43_42 TaxID=1974864 RepID=A0A2M8KY93_9BACT|nr:MAG: hypothetical protein COU90_00080 [Candidatus Ryanbacteria bacterium CG10_big_fil_rev_8_21_14_0_10_43_42]
MWEKIKENADVIVVAIVAFLIGFGSASLFGGNTDGVSNLQNGDGQEITDISDVPFEIPGNMDNEDTSSDTVNNTANDVTGMESMDAMETAVSTAGENVISVDNQRAGNSVRITRVGLAVSGWVAVREVSQGVFGNVLGAAWFPAGMHTDVDVELLRGTEGGEEYAAVLYVDTADDHQFFIEQEQLVTNEAGSMVMSSFNTVANPSGF